MPEQQPSPRSLAYSPAGAAYPSSGIGAPLQQYLQPNRRLRAVPLTAPMTAGPHTRRRTYDTRRLLVQRPAGPTGQVHSPGPPVIIAPRRGIGAAQSPLPKGSYCQPVSSRRPVVFASVVITRSFRFPKRPTPNRRRQSHLCTRPTKNNRTRPTKNNSPRPGGREPGHPPRTGTTIRWPARRLEPVMPLASRMSAVSARRSLPRSA